MADARIVLSLGGTVRFASSALLVAALVGGASSARADGAGRAPAAPAAPASPSGSDGDGDDANEDDDLTPVMADHEGRDEFEAFPLVTPHKPHRVRAALEIGGVLAIGFVDYLLNTSARGGDVREGDERWGLRYSWADLRGKFTGSAYELDNNLFGTNYAAHPFAGTMYYQVARSNHLSMHESLLLAGLASATWDYFGEIREKVSINDSIVTPLSGVLIGEPLMQLSWFFRRSRKTVVNEALSFLFAPPATVNHWFDGGEPVRSIKADALGLAQDPWHRFDVRLGLGVTRQSALSPAASAKSYVDERFEVDFAVNNLPSYVGEGRRSRIFSDGNLARVRVSGAWSEGQLVDGLFATRIVPVGFYLRDASEVDGSPRGYGAVLGLLGAFEYGAHDYDRDRARPRDLVAMVSPLGVTGELTAQRGLFRARTSLDLFGSMAGVQAYALPAFEAARGARDGLPTTLQKQGYYHALAVTAQPSVEVGVGPVDAAVQMRLDTFRAIRGIDSTEAVVDRSVSVSDRRIAGGASLGWQLPRLPVRLAAHFDYRARRGDVGDEHADRKEQSLWGSIGVRF